MTTTFIDIMSDVIANQIIADEMAEIFVKATEVIEEKFKPKLQTAFTKQELSVLSRMKKKPLPEIKAVSEEAEAAAETYMSTIFIPTAWQASFETVGRPFITEAFREAGQEGLIEVGLETSFNLRNPRAKKILDDKVFNFAKEVNLTTQDKLRIALAQGLDAGDDIKKISQRVADVFEIARGSRTDTIARTEILGASNHGTFEGYAQSGIVLTNIWVETKDDRTRPAHTSHSGVGGEEVKLNELFSNGLRFPHDPRGPAEEVINCLIDPKVQIFTDAGWRGISKISIGDKVLTHKNRFKPVTAVLDSKPYAGEVVKIFLPRNKYISATPEHGVLMSDGNWKPIGEIVAGESVKVMAAYCGRCQKPIPYWRKYCSFSCNSKDITDRQWNDPEHRRNMSEKAAAQMRREYADGTRDPMTIAVEARRVCHEKYGAGGYLGSVRHLPEFTEKINRAKIEKYGSVLECMKQTAFKGLGKVSWNGSSIERSMKRYLDFQEKEYKQQFVVGRRRTDFYIPMEKIFIECDSAAYHSDKEKDRKRDLEILMLYPDHKIAHVFYGNGPPEWEIFDLERLNHTGTFEQIDSEVMEVRRWVLKQPRRLYNFAVEDDESYFAAGIVLHNCRCTHIAGKLK